MASIGWIVLKLNFMILITLIPKENQCNYVESVYGEDVNDDNDDDNDDDVDVGVD